MKVYDLMDVLNSDILKVQEEIETKRKLSEALAKLSKLVNDNEFFVINIIDIELNN